MLEIKKQKFEQIDESGPWSEFRDMYSGGTRKENWATIYIQATLEMAEIIFFNIFNHNPNRVTCPCGGCGADYKITEYKDLRQATGYHRRNDDSVLVIPKSKIKDRWRSGKLPRQGYVWVD
jgi:hypothetical protein